MLQVFDSPVDHTHEGSLTTLVQRQGAVFTQFCVIQET